MKYFLLIAGAGYYPRMGDGDWKQTFETREEAEAAVIEVLPYDNYDRYKIDNGYYDWYKIIDLRDWIGTNKDAGE